MALRDKTCYCGGRGGIPCGFLHGLCFRRRGFVHNRDCTEHATNRLSLIERRLILLVQEFQPGFLRGRSIATELDGFGSVTGVGDVVLDLTPVSSQRPVGIGRGVFLERIGERLLILLRALLLLQGKIILLDLLRAFLNALRTFNLLLLRILDAENLGIGGERAFDLCGANREGDTRVDGGHVFLYCAS